ncbi:MAG: VOC family protein [Crocinitomicaceae bacterium]|nr:VOC family protein [Crocinitomicaceae bacterium]
MENIHHCLFIVYAADQEKSKSFYADLLKMKPSLHVPGMTEFTLSPTCKIGIMPEAGISKILLPHTKNPVDGNGIPRCEIYLTIDDVDTWFTHALQCGAIEISKPVVRDWGHRVAYVQDQDGHIIALAQIL